MDGYVDDRQKCREAWICERIDFWSGIFGLGEDLFTIYEK